MSPNATLVAERPSLASPGAVSWGAILAGAAGAAALSMVLLLLLGTGLGLTAVSPWTSRGASAAAVGVSALAWLAFTQLAASGLGGYLAGRLRTRWQDLATDEVFFRDTAHGFLAWSVASVATAALLATATGAIVSGGVQAGASVAQANATAASRVPSDESIAYFTDTLFRKAASPTGAVATQMPQDTSSPLVSNDGAAREASRIFMTALRQSSATLPPDDAQYLGQVVAQRTGLAPQDSQKRVADTYARVQEAKTSAQQAADKARKASATAALWIVVSLFIGAFVASFSATLGGRLRDA